MDPVRDFLAMGGYAAYIWPAFVLSALVLGGVLIASTRALRRSQAALSELGDKETSAS